MVLGIIIGIIILGAVCFFALDKKSDFHTRLISLGALALMVLTVIVCLIIVLTGDRAVPVDESVLIVGAPVVVQEKSNNIFVLLFSIVFILILLVAIVFFSMKEHHKVDGKKP